MPAAFLGFVIFVFGVVVGALASRLGGRKQATAALGSLGQIDKALADAKTDLEVQRRETETARRQRDEHFACIEGVVKEAQQAKKLYISCGASHGAAQGMMLNEIESLTIQYRWLAAEFKRSTGKPAPRPEPRLDQTIQFVANEFRDEHVENPAVKLPPPEASPGPVAPTG